MKEIEPLSEATCKETGCLTYILHQDVKTLIISHSLSIGMLRSLWVHICGTMMADSPS
jgi:quinol monooxygenase YgiN